MVLSNDGERRLERGATPERTGFDPYHQWLGIPAAHQPPHLYRLIGVSPFERDPDVIATAAQIRMKYLERRGSEAQGELAKQLQSEVRAGMELLLQPAQRKAYESELAAKWGVSPEQKLPFDAAPWVAPISGSQESSSAAPPLNPSPPLNPAPPVSAAPLPPHLQAAAKAKATTSSASSPAPLPPHLAGQAAPSGTAATVSATPTASTATSPAQGPASFASSAVQESSLPGASQGTDGFAVPAPRVRRKVSKRNRWVAGLLVALAFMPVHALLGYIGYRLASDPPAATGSGGSTPIPVADDPDTRLPTAPEAGSVLEFVPSAHVEWPAVKPWWSNSNRGTIEAWVTVPRTTGFVPLFGIYSELSTEEPDPDAESMSISASRGWNGWVLGLDRKAEQTDYELVIRRRSGTDPEVASNWTIKWPMDDRSPHHVALVLDGQRATMLLDGERVGDLPLSELRRGVHDHASFWIGAGAALHEPGSWRGMLLDLRVSDSVREIETTKPRAGWRVDPQTVLLFDRSVQSATGPSVVRDASRHQLVGELRQAKWSEWKP